MLLYPETSSFHSADSSTDLFEVGKLDELHSHLRVLQLHGFAHAGLGVCCGQTDQGLQRTGRHWRGLRRRRRGGEVRVRSCDPNSCVPYYIITVYRMYYSSCHNMLFLQYTRNQCTFVLYQHYADTYIHASSEILHKLTSVQSLFSVRYSKPASY